MSSTSFSLAALKQRKLERSYSNAIAAYVLYKHITKYFQAISLYIKYQVPCRKRKLIMLILTEFFYVFIKILAQVK